jgi:hypothetical protein
MASTPRQFEYCCLARHALTLGVLGIIAVATAGEAAAQRAWHAQGRGLLVVATDCRDCEEDAGIQFRCLGLGRPAEVSVPAVALEQRPEGRRHRIEFIIDGLPVAYNAELERQGSVGFVPTLRVRPDDPLIVRIARGSQLRVSFAGRNAEIILRGSRPALAAFASECAWGSIARALSEPAPLPADASGKPPAARPDVPAAERAGPTISAATHPEMRWQYYAGSRDAPARLSFGVPETENAVLIASCWAGTTRMLVELLASPAGLESGKPAEIGLHTSAGIEAAQGVINQQGRATFASKPDDRLWTVLRAGGATTFSVGGRPAGFVESGPGERAIVNFLASCR